METMDAPVSASQGAMRSLPRKLESLLSGPKQGLRPEEKKKIRSLQADLQGLIDNYLFEPSEVESPASTANFWMKDVRDLSYDIDDFIYELAQGAVSGARISAVQIQKPPRVKISRFPEKLKRRQWITDEISGFRTRVREAIQRHGAYLGGCRWRPSSSRELGERQRSAPSPCGKAAIRLVGMDSSIKQLCGWLANDGQPERKVASIVGTIGVGKTTLAREVYRKLGGQFECRAFVQASQKQDMKMILASLLSQVRRHHVPDSFEVHKLLFNIKEHLQDKTYIIVIDNLWASSTWDIISHALPKGNYCSTILTTTEVNAIAQTCCADTSKYIFKKEPLSEDESRDLFLSTVFGHEAGCPQGLKEVSNEIIKRSGGLPLAIIILASLLAGQPASSIDQLNYIQNSLSSDLSTNTSLEGITQVLNLGYDNLPHGLKACMLYLCLYEEDRIIWKDDLVKQWIAEGFIHAMKGIDGKEVARSYFDELVNRGMIQPVDINCNDEILSCRVHNMVLHFIRYKSIEENFTIALDHSQTTIRLADKVRRLALHFGNVEHATLPMLASMRLSQVRSVFFSGLLKCMPSVVEFRFIQVLILKFWDAPDNRSDNLTGSDDLSGNIIKHDDLSDNLTEPDDLSCNLTEISELFRLRYFHLDACHMSVELPTQMKRLKDLVAWEIDADVTAVPSDIVDLPGLFFLSIPSKALLPTGIGRMTSLHTLGVIDLSKNPTENIMFLGELTNLQDLRLTCSTLHSDNLEKNLECLGLIIQKLSNLKSVTLVLAVSSHVKTQDDAGSSSMTISWHGFTIVSFSPSLLQRLELSWRCCIFSSLPEWTKDLTKLGILKMAVRKVSNADVVILKGLPSLTALSLFVWTAPVRRIIFDNEGFLILKYFKFVCLAPCLVFLDRAMPKVQNLKLGFNANRMERYSLAAAGLEHLTGLNELSTKIGGAGTNECCKKSTHLALMDAIRKHTSTPIINVQWVDWNYCGDEENYIEASKEIRERTLEKQGAAAGESSDEHGVQEKKLEGDAKKPANIRTYTLQESTSHLQSTVHNISEAEDEWLGPSPGDDELGHERDTAVEEAVRVVEQWESPAAGVRLVFESPEDAEEYLAATTCLVGLAGAHAETVLQVAMARLEEEFRQLLIRGTASLTVEDLHDFLLPRLSLTVPTPSCASSIDLDYTWTSVSDEGDKSTGWGTSSSVSDDEISPYVPETISTLKGIVSDVMYSSSYLIFPDTVSTLKDIADVMLCAGYTTELSQVYSKVRRDTLVEWLAMLGVDKMSLEEVQMVEWASLNGKIKKWTHALKVVVQGLLAEERRICSQIFAADAGTEKECFAQVAEGCILQLLNFGLAIATGKRSPEKLFRILGMYEALAELLPELEALFLGEAKDFIKNEAERILVSLGDAVRGTVAEFAEALQGDTSRRAMPGGVIHPLTRYVMDYVQLLEDHSCFLNNLLDGCQTELENVDMTPWEHCVLTLITHLLNKIEDKSKLYDDEALQKIFLINNLLYILQKVNDSELKTVLGDNWICKLRGQIRTMSTGYLRSSWNRVLDCLRDDELPHTTGSPNALKDALKERFRNFNLTYEKLYRTQTAWQVVDPQLREELKISISERVIPAYRLFFRRYRGQLDGVRNIVKYNPEELENQISDFFHGDDKLGHERDTAVVVAVRGVDHAVRGVDHAVTGAMGSLIPKLGELLMEEYNLPRRVKKDVNFLWRELEIIHAALIKVGEVPRDKLDKKVKLWADEVRELSYNMEDVVDKFLVRVDGIQPHDDANRFKGLMKSMIGVFKKGKNHHRIADAVKEIKEQLQEVAARRDRNKVDGIPPNPTEAVAIDPCLRALYTEATELVGIYGNRDQELMRLLSMEGDDASNKRLKKVSIVGFGGLGKTTLARAVYEKIKGDFDCRAFVPVGQNPDIKNVFRDILIELDNSPSELVIMDAIQLIDKLRELLENKRYLIIIDDIWDESSWKHINVAFSNRNNLGSRLITTTRIFNVSESCCSSADDSIYQMEPLSPDDSKRLFYKRIFSSASGCPYEFEQVSTDILKKCGGVPLAIITIASALVGRQMVKPKCEWDNLLQSLGLGLTEDNSLDEMRRIISFSYYDLPSRLRTCLLYLSIYPEGSEIDRDRLIWKWVAERFVQCGNQGTSLYLLGLNYFNQLINRSIIQPIYDDMGEVHACRVHAMVLDLICNLSHEAKFVKLLDGTGDIMSSESNIRHLSLQNRNEDPQGTPIMNFMGMSRVRSITIFPSAMSIMPALSRFEVLRVLDLFECNLGENSSLQHNLLDVGHLIHLRYLGLARTGISELPAEIGNLQFLEVLDLEDNYVLDKLPSTTICKLRRLICLRGDMCEVAPGVLQNLTSIEVLKQIWVSLNIVVQELGNLSRLRELEIFFMYGSLDLYEGFVESLCKLHHIESLSIDCNLRERTSLELMNLLGERWVPPVHLRKFESYMSIQLSALRRWIKRDPSHLSNLSQLILCSVKEVQQEDVEIIGGLLSLRLLYIESTHQTQRLLVIRADGFRCLVHFHLDCGSAAQILFEPGALQKAELVEVSLGMQVAKEDGNCGFDLGLQGNLLSLRRSVCVYIYCGGARVGEAKKAKAAVRHALHDHPNHPKVNIFMRPHIQEGAQDDDICEEYCTIMHLERNEELIKACEME